MVGLKTRAFAETVLFMAIEFGILFLLLFVENIDFLSSSGILVISILYGIIIYYVSKSSGEGNVRDILYKSNKRRIGAAILFFIVVTIISSIYLYRPLNILAIFMTMDVLISLLPGKVVLCGGEMWKESKVLYILTLSTSLAFLLINIFGFNLDSIIMFFTNFFGIIGIILISIIAIIIILGLVGIRPR